MPSRNELDRYWIEDASMSDKLREQLSCLMDGELPHEECELVVRRLKRDEDLLTCWTTYHLISDTIRDALGPVAARDLTQDLALPGSVSESRGVGSGRRKRWQKRMGVAAAGVFLLATAGYLGSVVSQRVNERSGRVLVPSAASASQLPATNEAGWSNAQPPVRHELNRYLIMHNLAIGDFESMLPAAHMAELSGFPSSATMQAAKARAAATSSHP